MKSLIALLVLVAGMAHAAVWERPAGGYTPTNHSVNTTKYQTDRANAVAISSVKVDGDLNKAFEGLNNIEGRTPPSAVGQAGKFLTNNGSTSSWEFVQPVISVTVPDIFVASSSPNTISLTLSAQPRNTFFAGPVSGTNAVPTMRALVPLDFSADLMKLMRAKAPPQIANSTGDAANDIDIAAGSAVTDNGIYISTPGLTKRLDDAWVAGTNQGGLDTGSKANNAWYHVFLIHNPSTSVVDGLYSTSALSPTLPSGFTEKRRVGSVRTDGSGNILGFVQSGDEFQWATPTTDYSGGGTTTATLTTVTVPTGYSSEAMIYGSATNTDGGIIYRFISSPLAADVAPGAGNLNAGSGRSNSAIDIAYDMRIRTNTSGQVRHRSSANAGSLTIKTKGWIDRRGRDD